MRVINPNNIHPNDDLWYALEHNPPTKFSIGDVKDIIAEVPGENDEYNWYWILELNNGKFVLLSAWCDYTGWDCNSAIDIEDIYNTVLLAVANAPVQDKSSGWYIQQSLIGQIAGKYPKYLYALEGDNND